MANELISIERLENFHDDITVDAHILKRSTAYAVDDKVNKGLIYLKCTQAGTTASTALSLSGVSVGDELTDGTAEWKVISIKGVPEGGGGTGAGLEDWESNHDYAVDDIYVYEGEIYKTLIAFTSGATEDSRTKVNNIVPSVWAANTAYTTGDIIEHTDVTTLKKVYYDVTANFTSGATFEVTAEMDELQITEEYVPNPLTKQQVKNLIRNFVPSGSGTDPIFYNDSPIGTIIAYMGITAPKDYLACDGQTYNIVDYKELAEYIKRQFGSYNYFGGDGTTTFAVPDLRGEFLRGTGTNSHTNIELGELEGSGANVGVHQSGTVSVTFTKYNDQVYTGLQNGVGTEYVDSEHRVSTYVYSAKGSSGSQDTPSRYTSRPTNTSVLYCIKYNTSVLSTPENNYSTEEQRIGTWIDGKPLYQKTFVGSYSPVSPPRVLEVEIDGDSSYIDLIVGQDVCVYTSDNFFVFDSYYDTNYFISLMRRKNVNENKLILTISKDWSAISQNYLVTLKYTKTTD